jgi:hypothetical protein
MSQSTITRPISPQSVLGFSHAALAKLKESRSLLENYVSEQTTKLDSIQADNQSVYQKKCDEIQQKMNELKRIQRQRGVQQQSNDGECDDDDGHEMGIQHRLKKMQEKQMEVERELANLHLEKKQVSKKLLGE